MAQIAPLNSILISTAVGTVHANIISANPKRLWLALVNPGPDFMYIRLMEGYTVLGSIRLNSGGSITLGRTTDMPWFGEVGAVCNSGSQTLRGAEVEYKYPRDVPEWR